jgi:SAM-dependent methyltransferase
MLPEVKNLRKHIFDFINDVILLQSFQSVLEIGPMNLKWTPVKNLYVDTRTKFMEKNIDYLSVDCDDLSEADVICDIVDLNNYIDKTFDAIIALDVLEHVAEIWKVPKIFHSLLNEGGKLFISLPFYFYNHQPHPDYWRLSEDAIRLLFGEFFEIEIDKLCIEDERKPLHFNIVCTKK